MDALVSVGFRSGNGFDGEEEGYYDNFLAEVGNDDDDIDCTFFRTESESIGCGSPCSSQSRIKRSASNLAHFNLLSSLNWELFSVSEGPSTFAFAFAFVAS